MRDKILLFFATAFLCGFLFSNTASSQTKGQITLNGKITDTISHESLENATVSLLAAKDSILEQFTRAGKDGSFSFKGVDTGKYVLLITYPQYADYVDQFRLDGSHKPDLQSISMIQKEHLLEDVIVKQQIAAIRFKGDTTEFNADSFRTQPNANVEDLLKLLPGMQVDKDGKITAQGKTVDKVLVDGEEFFGDDPTLVTKNLRADMVDKVQMYDRTSDQEAFTGIADGDKKKTLNIKLKADKKNGYFGKLSAGVGTDKFYESQGMFNRFKAKHKFSAYGTFGNTGKTGLGFEDAMKYGGAGDNMQVTDDGGIMFYSNSGSDDPLSSFNGTYNGQGIPTVNTGGVHYDTKWGNDQQTLNLNYKIGNMGLKGSSQTSLQNNLPDGVLFTNSQDNFNKSIFRQKIDGMYEVKFDTTSTLKLNVSGSLANNSSHDQYATETNRGVDMDTLVNRGNRSINNDGHDKSFSANALWMKKLKKKGRTISVNVSDYLKNSDVEGFLNSDYDYYTNGTIDSSSIIDQRKTGNSKNNNFDTKVTYTEPLSTKTSLVLNYGINSISSNSDIRSFNKGPDGYTELDQDYSNHYKFDQFANRGGAALNYNYKKNIFNIGTNVSAVNYTQTDLYTGNELKRSFLNWNPSARYTYKMSQTKAFRVNYYGNTSQPSLQQIQPVRNNSDDQNIYIGNPDLKPSFSNSFSLGYDDYKIIHERYFSIYGSYSFQMDPIVTDVSTDVNSGRSTYRYTNLNQNTANYYTGIYYYRKSDKLKMNIGFDLSANGNKYANITNGENNVTNANNYSLGVNLRKSKEKVFDANLRLSANYQSNSSTLQKQIDNNYWSYNIRPDFDVYLPAKFQIHTDLSYDFQQKTEVLPSREQAIWNAWVGKKFFKKENLLLKISANDILDQNRGFNRSVFNNTISQNFYTTIHRYFMLSLVWDFNKMGGEVKSK